MHGHHRLQVVREEEIVGIEHGQQRIARGLDGTITRNSGSMVTVQLDNFKGKTALPAAGPLHGVVGGAVVGYYHGAWRHRLSGHRSQRLVDVRSAIERGNDDGDVGGVRHWLPALR